MKSIKLGIVFGCFMVMLGCNCPALKYSNNMGLLYWETATMLECPSGDQSMHLGLFTDGKEYWVQCLNCNMHGPHSNNCKDAVDGWNNR